MPGHPDFQFPTPPAAGPPAAPTGRTDVPGFTPEQFPTEFANVGHFFPNADRPGIQTGIRPSDLHDLLPGFTSQEPIDFGALLAGAGGVRPGRQAQGGADFLSALFGGGAPQISGDIRDQLLGAPGTSLGAFDAFRGLVGEDNPLVGRLLQFIGDPAAAASAGRSGSVGGSFGGGGSFVAPAGTGKPFKIEDIEFRDIPEFMKELLGAESEAQREQLALEGSDREGRLVAELFGRGISRSNQALDRAGRLNFGEKALSQKIQSDEANRRLELIKQDALQRGDLRKAELAANAQREIAQIGAASRVQAAGIGANASLGAARLAADQAARSDTLRALSGLVGGNLSALTSGFGSALGSFGQNIGTLAQAGSDELSALLGVGELAQAGIRDKNQLALGAAGLNLEQQLGLAQLMEGQQGRFQSGILDLVNLDFQNRFNEQQAAQMARANDGPGFLEQALGVVAPIAAGFFTGGAAPLIGGLLGAAGGAGG